MRFTKLPLILGLSLLALNSAVQAASSVATVKALQYPAWIEQGDKKVPLVPGATITVGTQIASGADARVLMTLPDGSEMRLGQKAKFSMTRLAVEQSAGSSTMDAALSLITGHFRYATSTIGRITGQRRVDLKLASATIGVRGTDYWAMVDQEHEAVCLFEGKVDVAHPEQGVVPLEQPTAFWTRHFNKPPQAPGNATAEELKKFLGWVDLQPGAGVAIEKGRWRVVVAAEATAADAQAINTALREQGYPSQIVKSYGLHEVRLNDLATRADGEALLKRLSAQTGLSGNNAKVVAAR